MTTNKKLGLLLLPLIPLSALGIVEVASRIMPSAPVAESVCIQLREPVVAVPSTPPTPPATPVGAPSAAPDA